MESTPQQSGSEREASGDTSRASEVGMRYLATHAPCLIWSGVVTQIADDLDDIMSFFWETAPLDEDAAQAFFPLELTSGHGYLYAWEIHRLPEDRHRVYETFRTAVLANRPEYTVEFGCRGRSGVQRYFSERVLVETLAERQWRLIGVATDITERREAEAKIQKQADELSLLFEAGQLIGQSLDFDTIYASFREMVGRHMDTDALLVSEYTADDNHIRTTFAWSDGQRLDTSAWPTLTLNTTGRGLQSRVIVSGEPLRINDYVPIANPAPGSRFFADSKGQVRDTPEEGHETRSMLLIPIRLNGRVLGVVQVQSYRRDAYGDEEQRLLEAMTQQVAAASRNAYLYQQLERAARQQRVFLRDMLYSVTEGRLLLCDTPNDLPAPQSFAIGAPVVLSAPTLRYLRQRVRDGLAVVGFPPERTHDLEIGAGEAAMNAVVHGGGGMGRVYTNAEGTLLQVWIEDHGSGIPLKNLPLATLQKGFTTAGTFGHGFKIILSALTRTYLLTSPSGTTVVLEQDRDAPPPLWEAADLKMP